MTMIKLPYSNLITEFDSEKLHAYLLTTIDKGIPIGARQTVLSDHDCSSGLDYWIRVNCSDRPDTKQIVKPVIEALVDTGKFRTEQIPNGLVGRNPVWIFAV